MSNAPLPPGASSPRDRGREERVSESRDLAPERERDRDDDRHGSAPVGSTGGANSSTMALILHAVTALCCMNWIFGIAGITFAVRAAHARDRGRPDQAEVLTRYSWYCLGAAGVMFFVMLVLTFVMFTQAGNWIQQIVPVTNF
ncbi:hypothetical protein NE857_30635 [Nocardiopsis exhalans]|uniref:Interferon-induced transmembrane protein n=1 Tax=Nocardiopsis exhalans TaxID=163604 RepID=A0ABY5D591_9ACTN|nr:hypothetical protein [Nocardiopsis exhalans]USY19546.1 hypothetical protein NE857_30635 [Nocardiopsis exhalans]